MSRSQPLTEERCASRHRLGPPGRVAVAWVAKSPRTSRTSSVASEGSVAMATEVNDLVLAHGTRRTWRPVVSSWARTTARLLRIRRCSVAAVTALTGPQVGHPATSAAWWPRRRAGSSMNSSMLWATFSPWQLGPGHDRQLAVRDRRPPGRMARLQSGRRAGQAVGSRQTVPTGRSSNQIRGPARRRGGRTTPALIRATSRLWALAAAVAWAEVAAAVAAVVLNLTAVKAKTSPRAVWSPRRRPRRRGLGQAVSPSAWPWSSRARPPTGCHLPGACVAVWVCVVGLAVLCGLDVWV